MSTEQFREFAGVVLRSLPDDLPPAVAQRWINNGAELRKVLRETLYPQTTAPTFSRDMTKEGWELIENSDAEPVPASDLELVAFLKRGESYVTGEEMVARAKKKKADLGQRQAEYFLENQEEIPPEWRQFNLVFPGTVWWMLLGGLRVPRLFFSSEMQRWVLYFGRLAYDWGGRDRLLRPRQ
jgi:hypothetical protein